MHFIIPLFILTGTLILFDSLFYFFRGINSHLIIRCLSKIIPVSLLILQTFFITVESLNPPDLQTLSLESSQINNALQFTPSHVILRNDERGFHPYLKCLLGVFSCCLIGDLFLSLDSNYEISWSFYVGMCFFAGSYFLIGFSRLFMPYQISKLVFVKRSSVYNYCYKIVLPICLYLALGIMFLGHFTTVLLTPVNNSTIPALGILTSPQELTQSPLNWPKYSLIENNDLNNSTSKSGSTSMLVAMWIYSGFIGWAGVLTFTYLLLAKKKYRISASLSAIGTFCLIVSDIILVENIFLVQKRYMEFAVMFFYWIGLTLLSWSVVQNWSIEYQLIP